jgi:hypothetical protein
MKLIGGDDRGAPAQRVEGVKNLNLLPQTPGIMKFRRTRVV